MGNAGTWAANLASALGAVVIILGFIQRGLVKTRTWIESVVIRRFDEYSRRLQEQADAINDTVKELKQTVEVHAEILQRQQRKQ